MKCLYVLDIEASLPERDLNRYSEERSTRRQQSFQMIRRAFDN